MSSVVDLESLTADALFVTPTDDDNGSPKRLYIVRYCRRNHIVVDCVARILGKEWVRYNVHQREEWDPNSTVRPVPHTFLDAIPN